MNTCNLFDRYRDRELSKIEQRAFEDHLKECDACRTKRALLNRLVQICKAEELPASDLSAKIARQAFRKRYSWDALVVSWLRPGAAIAALAVSAALFSILWMVSNSRQGSYSYSEYEKLMYESESATLDSRALQSKTYSELVEYMYPEGRTSE
jgi:hypothetical protein